MKPLPVLPLTEEDFAIFARAFHRGPAHRWLYHMTQLADRRDAEIMLGLATATACGARMWWIGRQALHEMGLGPPAPGYATDPPPARPSCA